MKPLISIIVPIYNVEKYIGKCIQSVFDQTYENIEYIFVNDCSPDKSVQIIELELKNYPNRVKNVHIIHHSENKGIAATRNTGLKHASGLYILQVDGDDYIEKDTVYSLVEVALAEKADIVTFDYFLEWKEKNKIVSHYYSDNKNEYLKFILEGRSEPAIWNKFIKKELFLEVGASFHDGVNYGEDYMVVPRLIYGAKKIIKIDKPFYHYIRWNVNSYSSNIKDKNIKDLVFVLNEHLKYFVDFKGEKGLYPSIEKGLELKIIELLRDVSSISQYNLIYKLFVVEDRVFYSSGSMYGKIVMYLFKNKFFFMLMGIQRIIKFLRMNVQYIKGRM
ncbi:MULTISPECIES: glycosyltransferase family 2 protein [unclassified Acinetobacter]|nr:MULTISPECIES: glycosyltransferase family 2 protein [unclassified Acinetobacter]MBJ9954547.1 glycosyltransferase family 2 protein [Acinetobacter baumannii]